MTNPMINPQPNYSGVTIQIANPAVYAGAYPPQQTDGKPVCNPCTGSEAQLIQGKYATNPQISPYTAGYLPEKRDELPAANVPMAYPPQYYLNNYNYQNNGLNGKNELEKLQKDLNSISAQENKSSDIAAKDILSGINDNNNNKNVPEEIPEDIVAENSQGTAETALKKYDNGKSNNIEQDFTKSKAIMDDLDEREAEIAAEKKNTKQKRVVALTDEYIKSLENYLNNPNDDIRLMASKDILTRLDEDKSRYDDAALNALLNKMLQDPSKLIRISALSAFASQLASGNDYTVTLLQNIQANPNADKEDVLQAADILLKMSGGTEVRNIPNPAVKDDDSAEKQGGNK